MRSGLTTDVDPSGRATGGAPWWAAAGRWLAVHTFAPPWLPERWRHPLVGYVAAVLLPGAAVAVVVGLADVFDGFAFPALLSLLMVALVALAWGMAPSLLATLVAAILLGALLHSTVLHLSENTEGRVVALALFLVAGGALSALAGRVERARRAAQLLARAAEQGRQDARIEAGRLDTVIDAMTNGLLVYDRDSRILRTNRAARAILGFAAQSDAVAAPPHEWAARDAQGRPLTEERWGLPRILRGETLTGADAIEMQVRVLDGREVRISASGAPLRDPAGHISGAVMVVQDVTELRRLERRTREALQALLIRPRRGGIRRRMSGRATSPWHGGWPRRRDGCWIAGAWASSPWTGSACGR